eukprot:403341486
MESNKGACNICKKPATNLCSKCKSVYYCNRDHQLEDWKIHKQVCKQLFEQLQNNADSSQSKTLNQSNNVQANVGLDQGSSKKAQDLIDKDNLKSNESVGTFRWNDSVNLVNIPQFKAEYRVLLKTLNEGWQTYLGLRFEEIANEQTQEINIQPHQLDGLSFSMTLVNLIMKLRLFLKENVTIVVMGGTAKAEERIFVQTNYYEELTNFFPKTSFKFYFVGPELSNSRNQKSFKVNERLDGFFHKGQISEFLIDQGINPESLENDEIIKSKFPQDSTFFIGYNPGFGSGYDLLLNSWCVDLIQLINLNLPVCFSQANDYSVTNFRVVNDLQDLRGETRVFQVIFEGKVNYVLEPQENPFRAATHYHEEGKKETSWSCSNTHFYGIKGWKDQNDKLTVKQVRENLKSQKGKGLLQELLFYLNQGGQQ